jgi:hypothetical protein
MKLYVALALLIQSAAFNSAHGVMSFGKKGSLEAPMCPIETTDDLLDAGALTACVSTGDLSCGEPRFVTSDATCDSGEVEVKWNLEGPQGPIGATGPTGEQGPQGLQGLSRSSRHSRSSR